MTQTIQNYYTHPPANGGQPKQIVLLLHGLGSNGRDLISLAPYWAKALPDAVFISPDAPFPCDMVPAGYPDSYQWFSLQRRDTDFIKNGIEAVFPILSAFMDGLLETYKLSPAHLALAGFSQGTMMSLYTAPRYTGGCIAGVLAYSGALYGADDLPAAAHKPPVCLIHGHADDVVPVSAYHHAKDVLEKAGFSVCGHTTPHLMHSIDERGISEGSRFLKSVLSI